MQTGGREAPGASLTGYTREHFHFSREAIEGQQEMIFREQQSENFSGEALQVMHQG